MKRSISFIICCIISFMLVGQSFAWDYPLDVVVTEISFNYSGSGAVTLRKNNGNNLITTPEWHYESGSVVKNDSFAYLKSAEPVVHAKFYSTDPDVNEDLTIRAVAQNVPSSDGFTAYTGWSLRDADVHFSSNEPEGTFNSGYGNTVPTSVGKWKSKLSWQVTGVGGQAYLCYLGETTHDYYTLLSTPGSFYNYDDNESGFPWTDVLDLACDWASGQSTAIACLGYLTTGLYNYQYLQYSPTPYPSYNSAESGLYLKTLLNAIDSSGGNPTYIDCRSYANLLCLLAYSVGFEYSSSESYGTGYIIINRDGTINTNTLLPAPSGTGSTSYSWVFHQIVYFYNENQYTNCIADASARAYNGGNPVLSKGDVTYSNYLLLLTQNSDIVKTGRSKAVAANEP